MPKFIYRAKRDLGDAVEGIIEAVNQDEALAKLSEQGLFALKLEPEPQPHKESAKQNSPFNIKIKLKKKIGPKDILVFTNKLTTLMRAKVELLSSLKILYEQSENSELKEIILKLYNSTKEGKPFSESLTLFPNIFSHLYINLIRSGEASGRLDNSLEQISEYLYREDNLRTKVSVALAYPVLLLSLGLLSIFVLINFVIPRLAPMFVNLGKDLPLITKIILQVSILSSKFWLVIFAFIALIVFMLYRKDKTFLKRLIRTLKTSLPILKKLTRNQELAHFSRELALLLRSGVPVLRALEISVATIEDPKLNNGLKNACGEIAQGGSLSKCMQTLTELPSFFVKMIAVGEESGRLPEVLTEISNSYTQQVEADIAIVTSLLEPVPILILGVILGVIVLSILLPTFQITQLVH